MKAPKVKKFVVSIPEKPSMYCSGPLVESITYNEFVDYSGGCIAESLFKGEMRRAVGNIIDMAMMRGKLQYHQELVARAKAEALDKRRKSRKVSA